MNRIKELRLAKCLTQRDVAKALGVSQAHYCRLEKGTRNIKLNQFCKLAEIFGVLPIELMQECELTNQQGGIMKKLFKKVFSFIFAPFKWVALGIRGGLAFILRSCFGCMVVYPKVKGKKNGK